MTIRICHNHEPPRKFSVNPDEPRKGLAGLCNECNQQKADELCENIRQALKNMMAMEGAGWSFLIPVTDFDPYPWEEWTESRLSLLAGRPVAAKMVEKGHYYHQGQTEAKSGVRVWKIL